MSLVLVDANVFIYGVNALSQYHQEAVWAISRLEGLGDELLICPQVALEFWSTATKSSKGGLSRPSERAQKTLALYLTNKFGWCPEPGTLFAEWHQLCARRNIIGSSCYDACLVALMNHYGIDRILTKNTKHFAAFASIQAIDPVSST